MNKCISVIVPIYNVEKFITGCLTSVSVQTYPHFECLCIDDGTQDNSGEIAEEFAKKDKRFKVFHQKNQGLSGARNTGLNCATGDYIFFLDSDDYIHPQTFEILVNLIEKHNVNFVCFSLQHTKNLYAPIEKNLSLTQKTKIYTNPLEAFIKKRNIQTGVCLRLYKSKFLKDLRFIEGICFEDVPFTTRVMDKTKEFLYINVPLYYYYTNPDSKMRTSFSEHKVDSYVCVIEDVFTYIQKNRPKQLKNIQKYLLNKRVKMMMNQIVQKKKDITQGRALYAYIKPKLKKLYCQGIISFVGLKPQHKIALWLLLNTKNSNIAYNWMRLFK